MSKNSMSPVRKATLRGKVALIGIGISPQGAGKESALARR